MIHHGTFDDLDLIGLIRKAGKIVSCSWAVGNVRHKSTGKWGTVIVFADTTGVNGGATHAYEIHDISQLQGLIARLQKCRLVMEGFPRGEAEAGGSK